MNKHLIYQEDAVKLLDALENRIAEEEGWQEKCDGIFQAKELIANMVGIEAEAILHGQWRFDGAWRNGDGIVNDYFCSCCGRTISVNCKTELENYPYCHCGAKMIWRVENAAN